MSKILKNQKPKTTFKDEINSIKITLLSYPDIEMTNKVIVNVCYGYDKPNIYDSLSDKEKEEAINSVISEGTLPKALEMVGKFVFLVENISLTVTHCLVRHRFFTILQSSTGVSDLRNESFVMPRSFNRNKDFYNRVKNWYLQGKELFVDAIDNNNISVQNARLLLPKNNCNHMFIGCDLKSLKEAYAQRTDTQEEIIQNNIIFLKMKDLVLEKFPYFKDYFKSGCEVGSCLHCKPGKHANVVFKRNELHKKFLPLNYDLDKEITLHDYTRDEMNDGPIIDEEVYDE